MSFYLVRAKPKQERLADLSEQLQQDAFSHMRPFGKSLTASLRSARIEADGTAVWEEEDYCSPPLAQEREAVLDRYFDDIRVEPVNHGEGWSRIENLPPLFPGR